MSNYPTSLDNDATLPVVYGNITEIGEEAINALRECVLNIENELGIGLSGTKGTLADRLSVAFEPDGYLNSGVLIDAGFIVGPVVNANVDSNAAIAESKLNLTYSTASLKSLIDSLETFTSANTSWISTYGFRVNTHLGDAYNSHKITSVYVDDKNLFLDNNGNTRNPEPGTNEENSLSYLLQSINNELLSHQSADGTSSSSGVITTDNGDSFSEKYAHIANGVFVDSSRFSSIPQEKNDVQKLFEYIDIQGYLVYGSRIQNFYTSGIPKTSRSTVLKSDEEGVLFNYNDIVLRTNSDESRLKCETTEGSNVVAITLSDQSNYYVDALFDQVSLGDVATVYYQGSPGISVSSYIIDKKYDNSNPSNRQFSIKTDKVSIITTSDGYITISKPKYNSNRHGSLYVAPAQVEEFASLIVTHPKAAMALGQTFNASDITNDFHRLYLELYPTGNPNDCVIPVKDSNGDLGFDVSGSLGKKTEFYTLSDIVFNLNNSFRASGVGSRFIAFQNNGNFGIMLADPYDRASFAILNNDTGSYVNNICASGSKDPLGFGASKANIASPSFASPQATPYSETRVIAPHIRNYFYVDGAEIQNLQREDTQVLDINGDGYWIADVSDISNIGFRNVVTFRIPLDLTNSNLEIGKTVVVLPIDGYYSESNYHDYGRFVISDITIDCDNYTEIKVYDARHMTGSSTNRTPSYIVNDSVRVYFSSDSVGLQNSSIIDLSTPSDDLEFYNEVFIDSVGKTFTSLRARKPIQTDCVIGAITLKGFNGAQYFHINNVSPKLRGYLRSEDQRYECVKFVLVSANDSTGIYSGYLTGYGTTSDGPIITGRYGVNTKFYTETYSDHVEIFVNKEAILNSSIGEYFDIQLFSTLSLNDETLLLGSCVVSDENSNRIKNVSDLRSFGNVSEKDLSTSALNYIAAYNKYLHANGVISGFDIQNSATQECTGGRVAINGKIVDVNYNWMIKSTIDANIDGESDYPWWAICVNESGNIRLIAVNYNGRSLQSYSGFTTDSNVILTLAKGAVTWDVETRDISELLLQSKDCVPLYLYNYNSDLSTSLYYDIRRFVGMLENKLDFIVSSDTSLSTHTLSGALSWIKNNPKSKREIHIDGYNFDTITVNETNELAVDSIDFIGRNRGEVSGISITAGKSKFKFKSLQVNGNVSLTNCSEDILFEDVYFNFGANEIVIDSCGKVEFKNCEFATSGQAEFDYKAVITSISNEDIIVEDGYFHGKFPSVLNSYDDKNITFNNNIIINSFKPIIPDGLGGWSHYPGLLDRISSTNPYYMEDGAYYNYYHYRNDVNGGCVYLQMTTNITSVVVENNKFTHDFTYSVGVNLQRYPFVNLKFVQTGVRLTSSKIQGNIFDSNITIPGGAEYLDRKTTDDIIAAILVCNNFDLGSTSLSSIVDSFYTNGYLYPPNDFERNYISIDILNNICNKNQGIVLSNYSRDIDYKYLSEPDFMIGENCVLCPINVNVKNNKCGYIGTYLIGGDSCEGVSYFTSNDLKTHSDIIGKAYIDSNICHWICTMTAEGRFIYPFRFTSAPYSNPNEPSASFTDGWSVAPLARTYITNNILNWIHVIGADITIISGNKLVAWNYEFLSNFYTNNYNTATDIHKTAYPSNATDCYSYSMGDSQAFAISVYRNYLSTVDVCIEDNNIYGQTAVANSNVYPYTYGDTIGQADPIGGGYIYAHGHNIKIINNVCKGFLAHRAGMRSGLITFSCSNVCDISKNELDIGVLERIWHYIGYSAIMQPTASGNNTIAYLKNYATDYENNRHVTGDGYLTACGFIKDNIFSESYTTYADWAAVGAAVDTTTWTAFTTAYIPPGISVKDNKNQTDVLQLDLVSGIRSGGSSQDIVSNILPTDLIQSIGGLTTHHIGGRVTELASNILEFHSTTVQSDTVYFLKQFSLNNILPNGSNIKKIRMQYKFENVNDNSVGTESFSVNIYLTKVYEDFTNQDCVGVLMPTYSCEDGYYLQVGNSGFIDDDFTYGLPPSGVERKYFDDIDGLLEVNCSNCIINNNEKYLKNNLNNSNNYMVIFKLLHNPGSSCAFQYRLTLSPIYVEWTY